jgi:hypothetical protein
MYRRRRRARRGRYALALAALIGGGAWWHYRHELPPLAKAPWTPKTATAQPVEKSEPVTVEEKRLDAMQRLGQALRRYTDANGGQYPPKLKTLTEEGFLPATAAESLWGPKGFLLQYSGAGAKRSDGKARVVLVFPAPEGTDVKNLIMFADGQTDSSGSVIVPGVHAGAADKRR